MKTCGVGKSGVFPHSSYWDNLEPKEVCYGHETWNRDQFYEGEFFRNGIHGQGSYKWRTSGVYEGNFYSNSKEGYALLSLPDNSYFEGLFVRNQPFGPGILTHSNGRQDAGFWMGRKLVRLSRPVDFIIPRLAPTSAAKIKLWQFRRLIPLNEDNHDSSTEILMKYGCCLGYSSTPYSSLVRDPRSFFFDRLAFEKTYFMKLREANQELTVSSKGWEDAFPPSDDEELEERSRKDSFEEIQTPGHCRCANDVFVMDYLLEEPTDVCDRETSATGSEMGLLGYYTRYGRSDEEGEEVGETDEAEENQPEREPFSPKIVAWNRSDLCTEMLKQIFRYRAFEEKLNFKIAKLMLGARTAFRRTGEREKQCLHFLKMCSLGPQYVVKELLCSYEISEELMDARGNNSLMFAVATDQHDIIDLLLDYGVDVNSFNDESLTPLNLCLLRRLAQAKGITNWEAAFLPEERHKTWDANSPKEEWRARESIPSLDRIFGDGMSINDSINLMQEKEMTERISRLQTLPQSPASDDGKDLTNLSEITVFNFNKSSEKSPGRVNTNPTPSIITKIVPKSLKTFEFEQSVNTSAKEKYLFDLSPGKRPAVDAGKKQNDSLKLSKNDERKEPEEKEDDPGLIQKIQEIDKTIEKLLQRGADPNISEVPKPSIHLAVYTRNLDTVHILLLFGANPDCRLYPNEGLLTPLHVLVLVKPAPEYVDICQLLLDSGANPAEKTFPGFSFYEAEKDFLDADVGRTPLQLLCMRPDLEYVDPAGHLIEIALLLARVSGAKDYYKGHSCLTLAMLRGNLKLLRALLESNCFDPNDLLGSDLGTPLHVLVSTDLQMRTLYDTSIKMCDLLLEGGANPLLRFESPEKLVGTCVDFGYREIEDEKNARKANAGKKGEAKAEKTGERDHLKDHVRVVEYLGKIAKSMGSDQGTGGEDLKTRKTGKENSTGKTSAKDKSQSADAKTKEDEEEAKDKEKSRASEAKSKDEGGRAGRSKTGNENEVETDGDGRSQRDSGAEGTKVKGRQAERGGKAGKEDKGKGGKRGKKDKGKGGNDRGKGARGGNDGRKSQLNPCKSHLSKRVSETFPEKLRQSLLRMFGNCVNVDINELLLPYVVLRNGDFYYRFHGKATKGKEQYSLV